MQTSFGNTLRFLLKIIHTEYQVTLYIVDQKGQLLEQHPSRPFNPIYDSREQTLALLATRVTENDHYPAVRATNVLEHYLTVPLMDGDQDEGTLIAGPFFHAIVPDELISGIIRDYHLSFRQQDVIRDFYQQVPLISKERIYNAAVMIHYMLYQEQLDIAAVIQHNLHIHIQPATQRPSLPSPYDEYEHYPQTTYHHNPEMEKIFMQYIRDGRKEDLVRWELGFPTEKLGVLSKKSLLRSEKNLAICSITLATRAAMDGGVNPEIGYTLSDFYIQAVEECQNPAEVQDVLRKCHTDFVDRVLESQRQQYSVEVNVCRNYMFNHLYEPMQLEQLAEVAGLSGDYLSRRFKKETGVSPVEFLQQIRVQEAQRLMVRSDYALAEIAAMLQFHDQSYFTKIFKKVVGMTPKQYSSRRSGGERVLQDQVVYQHS
ncbi:helix-turn-helix domain-containing protein [Paenibacillus kandeliae]|uniref:helix-turn-helix domain-containing protein n=1 Tax=Paenibacillus kandeliae TaxID=3231269 RepID=UPI003458C7A2